MNTERFKRAEYTKKRRAIGTAVFAVIMALFIFSTSTVYAASTGTVNSAAGLNMREGAGTEFAAIMTIGNGASVDILDDNVKASDGSVWYKVSYGGKTGYVSSSYISKNSAGSGSGGTSDGTFESQIAAFPESYRQGLRQIHAEHPNWKFTPVNTGISWDEALEKQCRLGTSLVENSQHDILKSVEKGAYVLSSGTYVSFDSGGWVAASEETVAYYMDPRNFLDKTNIFQFMSNKFDSSTQTLSTVEQVVQGTFLDGTAPKSSKSYAQIIFDAGKDNGVNPMVIASMILAEQGSSGNTDSISGTVSGYEGYYNYMNIGAYKSGSLSAIENGLKYAKSQGWDSPEKSIDGGAAWYAQNYVNGGKYTLYFQRFNVNNGSSAVGTGQYMTSIYGAYVEGQNLAAGYSSYGDRALTFEIPVYTDMPETACELPSGSGNNVNYLKSLSVEGGKLTSEFDPYTYTYTVKVSDGTSSAAINAEAYEDAEISGIGNISMKSGAKRRDIEVTSSSGKTRVYSLTLLSESFDGSLTAESERISGANRFQTAVNVADKLKKELNVSSFSNIVVAYSDDFADALSATALASEKNAPILVVNGNNESYVKSYIDNNLSKTGTVYLIGGTGVISERFEQSLKNSGTYSVKRLEGANRYETNIAVLKEMNLKGTEEIMVASGLDYADALSASATGNPIMLVGNSLTSSQTSFLKTLGGNDKYFVLGGPAAVSASVMNQLSSSGIGSVTRIYGDNRFETGLAVAEKFFEDAQNMVVASGDDFPDGLTGGVLANIGGSPVLLVNKYNTSEAEAFVYENVIQMVTAVGGTSAISQDTLNKIA